MGSKPMSPGIDPSSLSCRTKKGIDRDISSAFKETDPDRWDCCKDTTYTKREYTQGRGLVRLNHKYLDPEEVAPFRSHPNQNQQSTHTIEAGANAEAPANKRAKRVDFIIVVTS